MNIHFIGIGGIGVSALAQYYLSNGHKVSGSDLVSSEMTELLKNKGIKIIIGKHKIKNLSKNTNLVIYSPAVPEDNPELKIAQKNKIKCQSYPEALGDLTKKYFTIAISGTHGKSTTTAMTALTLIKAGLDPTVILGTKLKEFKNSNFRKGKSKYLIIEADEWKASFLNYFPQIIALTNIEREHLDYYKNIKHILKTYQEYINHLSKKGILIINGKDKNIKRLISNSKHFSILDFRSLKSKDIKKLKTILNVPGEYNVLNASIALSIARILKVPDKVSYQALSIYKGAWRRFEEYKLKVGDFKLKIISDYAHHPTEIKVTLKALREKFPQKEIWCVFQPHQYQRTFYLFKDFIKTFRQAINKLKINKVIITDIYDVAGREKKGLKNKINSEKLIKEINSPSAIYLPKNKIKKYLKKNAKGQEVIITMGAGDIYKVLDN